MALEEELEEDDQNAAGLGSSGSLSGHCGVEMRHFLSVLDSGRVKTRISEDMLKYYEEFGRAKK